MDRISSVKQLKFNTLTCWALTHGTYKLLIQLKCHQRIRQVSQPLLENTGDDMDVVVIQIHAVHICMATRRMTKDQTDT